MTTGDNKTLIMGAAVGYTAEQIAPFLRSLRSSGYGGEVLLIVEPTLARHCAGLPLFEGVIFLTARQWFPIRHAWLRQRLKTALWLWLPVQLPLWMLVRLLGWLPLPAELKFKWQAPLATRLLPPTESRYLHFLRFLQRQRRRYSRVLLSDVRDVLFQSNPFEQLPQTGLAVSIEGSRYTIATEPFNAAWVQRIYGAETLRKIAEQPVSCCGVTYGDGDSIALYLQLMCEGVLGLNFRAARQGVLDQGIHNVLLWTGRLGAFHRLETLNSPVATINGVDECELCLSADGKLLNADGSVVSVIHQYDRSPLLRAAFS